MPVDPKLPKELLSLLEKRRLSDRRKPKAQERAAVVGKSDIIMEKRRRDRRKPVKKKGTR